MVEKTLDKIRIDKWLWAVRAYKTRTLATDACNAGRIKINQQSVKPSYVIKIGDEVHISTVGNKKIYKCLQLIEKRVGASIAITCYEDLSPTPTLNELQNSSFYHFEHRAKGVGRPTKRNRRDIDKFKGS